MLTDFLTQLIEEDNACLLAINGWHAPWADTFMYAFSGKVVWVPLYASLLYVIVRNLRWRVALGCVVAVALTIVLADQIGDSLIRPWVGRLRPSNLDNPISGMVHIVDGIAADGMDFLHVMLPTPLVWLFLSLIFSVIGCFWCLFSDGQW